MKATRPDALDIGRNALSLDGQPRVASFAAGLERYGSATALILQSGERLSYDGLAAAADAAAAVFPAHRSVLALEMHCTLESVAAYLGALRAGHAVILLESLVGASGKRIIETWQPWTMGQDRNWHAPDLHPDLAVLLSTSGTTGSPKLVRLSHRNVEANARSIVEYLEIDGGDRAISSLPFYYSYGLSVLNSHLEAGASLILTDESVSSPEFWRAFEEQQATSIAGVPFTYEMLETLRIRERPLPHLRKMTQAGGRLPQELVKQYADWSAPRGIRFFVMYGQTEATARMAYLPPSLAASHSDCIGIPIPGGEFELADANDPERPGVGELVYRGPNVMMGYAESIADLSRGADLEALHTGDLAERTPEGLYRIVGRLSRFSKLFGLRISHDEVERQLAAKGITAVVTGDDKAVGVLTTGSAPHDIAAMLAERFALPDSSFVHLKADAIPRLPSGKTDYVSVRHMLEAARPAEAESAVDGLSVEQIFATNFPRIEVGSDDSFTTLGGDSLGYVNFSVALEKLLGFVPDNWEQLTVTELKALKPIRADGERRFLAGVDSDILVRAIAIVGVVLLHAGARSDGDRFAAAGGASVLLVLFGYNLARFQLGKLMSPERWQVVASFAMRIILPYYLLLLAYTVVKQDLSIPALLLVSNYVGRFGSTMEPFWFLEAILQCLLFVVLMFSVPYTRRLQRSSPEMFALAFVVLAILLKLVGAQLLDQHYLQQRTFDATLCYVALGWAAWTAKGLAARSLVFATCVGVSLYFWGWPDSHVWWMAGAMALVLFVPRVRLPVPVAAIVVLVASASFHIYLTHIFVIYGLRTQFGIQAQLFTVILSVVFGILFWRLWDAANNLASGRFSRGGAKAAS